METIILVTVLSTLGVVALVTAIVVAFFKLRKKVDVNSFDRETENIYNEIGKRFDSLKNELEYHVTAIYQQMNQEDEDIRRQIDSRLDKLDTKFVQVINNVKGEIKNLQDTKVSNGKQLLTD
jgi:predicted PurR-regulated permease PerM